ncbi:MAG TPA: hypothetical protein VFY93_03450 [Planctomycetota bacterium]|nr:hypothetical protein [Planctomycetota bacterium]
MVVRPGIKLQVAEGDALRAREILEARRETAPEEPEEPAARRCSASFSRRSSSTRSGRPHAISRGLSVRDRRRPGFAGTLAVVSFPVFATWLVIGFGAIPT